jgi:hypothetical protein
MVRECWDLNLYHLQKGKTQKITRNHYLAWFEIPKRIGISMTHQTTTLSEVWNKGVKLQTIVQKKYSQMHCLDVHCIEVMLAKSLL